MYAVKPWVLAVAVVAALGAVILLASFLAPGPAEPVGPPSPVVSTQPPTVSTAEPEPVSASSATESPTQPNEPPAASADVVPTIATDGYIAPAEYAHMTAAGEFEIHWQNDRTTIRVGLVSPGTGYVAIGFDPEQMMQGANYIMGAVRHDGAVIRDDYGNSQFGHAADVTLGGTQDIIAYGGREERGHTTFEFVMPLSTGDAMDKELVPGFTYRVIIAYHMTDDSFSRKHSRRGSGEIRLDRAP